MRKIIKKIATVVATTAMLATMSFSAFAETEDDYFMISGDARLFNVNEEENSDYWNTIEEDQELPAVEGMEGVYAKTFTCAADGDFQFKILKNGADFGWSFQMCIGNPDAAWADNQTQFQATMKAGDYTVYLKPSTGFVCIIQNQEAVTLLGRYHSRDEDSENYVALTKAAIEADGYSDVPDFDAAYAEFVNECVVNEGGTPVEITTAAETESTPETTLADDTSDDTNKSDATTAKTDADDDEDDGISTAVIVIIVVVVVVVIAAIVVVAKKKKTE
jgi:hypothetical protein